MTDQDLYEFLCVAIVLLGTAWLLSWIVRRLMRTREGFVDARQRV